MITTEWMGLAGFLLTNLGAHIGVFKYITGKIDKNQEVNDLKISRVYTRFDEHKKTVEDKFVVKDMCKIVHENSSETLRGMERRMTSSLKDLEKKVDDNFKVVIDLMKE